MPILAVIFDFNGVLVDDEHVHFELFRDVLAEEGITLEETTYHDRYLGYDDRGCFSAALIDNGREAPSSLISQLIDRKALLYAAAAETGLKFFDSAPEAISFLADRYPVAICSGALRAEIEYALQRLKVRDRVGSITSAEDTTACKPDPQGYLKALARVQGVDPAIKAAHCLVIEDSLAGLQAAKSAGMVAVGVTHTYSHEQLKDAGAIAVIQGLHEINDAWLAALGI
jgi:beta-phosphoglucomutase-like phosphatase (HAD superfamily)